MSSMACALVDDTSPSLATYELVAEQLDEPGVQTLGCGRPRRPLVVL
ncbi:hypothetical protein [Acidovorax carolinensis]|nr:hypothetical protein [Acidovorax carolinensis]